MLNRIKKLSTELISYFVIFFIAFAAFAIVEKYVIPILPMNKSDLQEKKIESLEKENEMYRTEFNKLNQMVK